MTIENTIYATKVVFFKFIQLLNDFFEKHFLRILSFLEIIFAPIVVLVRLIIGLSWMDLKNVLESKLVKNTYIWIVVIPTLATALRGVDEIYVFNTPIPLALPFNWVLLYVAAVLFFVARVFYIWRAPPFVRKYDLYFDGKASISEFFRFPESLKREDMMLLLHQSEKVPEYSNKNGYPVAPEDIPIAKLKKAIIDEVPVYETLDFLNNSSHRKFLWDTSLLSLLFYMSFFCLVLVFLDGFRSVYLQVDWVSSWEDLKGLYIFYRGFIERGL